MNLYTQEKIQIITVQISWIAMVQSPRITTEKNKQNGSFAYKQSVSKDDGAANKMNLSRTKQEGSYASLQRAKPI